jgi:bacillithiol biosynthesis cysteine-adding enzyme BshC
MTFDKGENPLNLKILAGFPRGSSLVRDYVQGETHLARFFEGDFRSRGSFVEKAREVDERFNRAARERVAAMVRAPSEAAREGLDRFLEEGGFLVTTGQQPGLFSGPLYSLYKALTAAKLAQALEPVLQRPVLPLFWVASEDHDWAEADHTHLLDQGNELQTFRLPSQDGPPNRPLHRIAVETGLNEVMDAFIQTIPKNDFSEYYIKLIRDSYPPDVTLSDGFRNVLEGLLAELPVLFVDAADPTLKEASLPVLLREMEGAEEHEALLHRVATHLEMEGYGVQVPILEGGVNLFLEGPAGRDRLYRDGQGFRLNHAQVTLTLEEIRRRAQGDPSLLSPNVLLRPVVESALFPTVSYVAGPGELAYFAQLKEFFHCHGIRMPVIFPRHSVTLVETKVGKVLEKFHLAVEGLDRPHHELAAEIAREEIPPEVRRALGEIRGAIGKGAGALTKAAQEIDHTLKGPVTNARNASFSAFDDAERKILQSVKRQNEIALGQLEKAQQNLYPGGKPQERMMNAFYYLARYGSGLIPALLEEFHVALGTDSA